MDILLSGKVLKTQTEDGYELDAFLVEPKKVASKVIIHFHGKEGDFLQNHFIPVMAKTYTEVGYAFMTASQRGKSYIADLLRKSATGYEYTQMGSAYDIFEDCVYDIDAWVKVAKDLGYKRIVLQQHSTPQKILWYVFKKNPKEISALILISPADIAYLFEKYVASYKKNLAVAGKLVKEGKERQLMPVNLWSNCPVSARTFYNWGSNNSNIQVFNYLHPERGWKYFPKVKLPMLALLAEDDFSVGNPPWECLDYLTKNTGSKNFASKIIRNTNHSYQGKEDELSQTILDWLKNSGV